MKPASLVVDDDKKTVDLIRLYLEKRGTASWWPMTAAERLKLPANGDQV